MGVLLAKKWKPKIDPTGWLMSEKLDGVRAYWDGKELRSRNGKLFYVPDWFLKDFPSFHLDGELFLERGQFDETVSIVRKQDKSDRWKRIIYKVFDAPEVEGGFEERIKFLRDWDLMLGSKYIYIMHQIPCKGEDDLMETLERVIEVGGEGLMLRKPGSKWVPKKSSTLLKVKKMHDAEATVVGYTDGKGKYEGVVGALVLCMDDGKEFGCGSGLSDAQRKDPPKIGEIVTYQYQEYTKSGVPRFPVFLRSRTDADL